MNKKTKGNQGENKAILFLKNRNYDILSTKYRSPIGEIDIIALHENKVIFIEVKTWDYFSKDSLEYSIGETKQKKIIYTARYFLAKNPDYINKRLQFDIILIKDRLSNILHIKEAFGYSK